MVLTVIQIILYCAKVILNRCIQGGYYTRGYPIRDYSNKGRPLPSLMDSDSRRHLVPSFPQKEAAFLISANCLNHTHASETAKVLIVTACTQRIVQGSSIETETCVFFWMPSCAERIISSDSLSSLRRPLLATVVLLSRLLYISRAFSLRFDAFGKLSLFRMYRLVLRLSADEPSRMALNRGLRLGIEAAIIAVQISTVVLCRRSRQYGVKRGGYMGWTVVAVLMEH